MTVTRHDEERESERPSWRKGTKTPFIFYLRVRNASCALSPPFQDGIGKLFCTVMDTISIDGRPSTSGAFP